MLFEKAFIPTQRETPKEAECVSHKLLLRGGYLYMVCSGIYVYLSLGLKVLNKISDIIRKHMNKNGGIEILMSALQPVEMWKKTGRDKDLEEVMFKFEDRKGRKLCLGPTHEEEVTEIAKRFVNSYKDLPLILYQIQAKFRDEIRPRFGLLRTQEFVMKDGYSFDEDEKGLDKNYQKMYSAYQDIFRECGLNFVISEAETGFMGGSLSHEFMAPAQVGEDILFYCKKCDKYFKEKKNCPQCGEELTPRRMIEVGHIFKLGTKYSSSMEAFFTDRKGERKPFVMGCYGIGVSRLITAIVEQNYDEKGIIWPKNVSPYQIYIIVLDEDKELVEEAKRLEKDLEKRGYEVLVDLRDEPAGIKFNDAYLIGIPYLVILGRTYKEEKKLEIEKRDSREKYKFSYEEFLNFVEDDYRKRD
ncbi:MAG: proline--tRNA ligase [Candidatus Omnitrophica bacterium 4484_70.2]|nr:MAG: proline--tRNA ligase [Candidatus Omnitrophica bacterium 4484_70.2]